MRSIPACAHERVVAVGILEAQGIVKHFGGVVALSDGNLHAEQGRITGLLGANGSGKSTISKVICGVHRQDEGTVVYDGSPVLFRNPHEARRAGVCMVFQHLSLIPTLSVWKNIVLGEEPRSRWFRDDATAIAAAEAAIRRLSETIDVQTMVAELDPGDAQLVEIAKAIYSDPRVLIMDEPTAALEQRQVASLFRLVRELAERGVAIVFISHRLQEVFEICHSVQIFRNGRRVADIDFQEEGRDESEVVRHIVGDRQIVARGRRDAVGDAPVLLSVDNLCDRAGFLHEVSLEIRRGEILGVGGLAGQGQYELLTALAGDKQIASGTIRMNGEPIRLLKPIDAIQRGVLLVPGDRHQEGLFVDHSVYDNLVFPRIVADRRQFVLPLARYRETAEESYRQLGIVSDTIDSGVHTLSGGNQQKIVVAKWMPFDIRLLILADPAKGVDVGAKQDLYRFVLDQVENHDTSVLLYASDNEELLGYSDRILVMHDGRIAAELTGSEMTEDRIVAASLGIERRAEQ
jgi:ribose transport system ATP-binding protein